MKRLFLLLLLALWRVVYGGWSMALAQVTNYSRWMAFLDDDAFVCQLSVPGAHDACSSEFSGILASIYKSFAQTQSKSVEAMLPLGVRLFDLRPCVSGSKLHINHGQATTKFDFDPVMQQLCSFVEANPTEFCIVVIRHESEGDSNNSNFGDMLQASLASIKDHLVDFRPNLTVGEARGKILFLSRDDYTAPIYGGRIKDLRDNRSDISEMLGGHCCYPGRNKCSWWMQDHYEISDDNVKKKAILDMLTKSSRLAGGYSYTWVVNQTSGYNGSTASASAYQNNAKICNQYLQQLLASGSYNGPAGLVLMDYAADGDNGGYYGLSLTKELVNHNFRYTMSKQGDDINLNGGTFIAPKGSDMMWEGKFFRKEGTGLSGPSGWFKMDFDDSKWETRLFPTASEDVDAVFYSQWDGTNNVIFIRREFYIDHDPSIDAFKFYARHDDDYKVYLNGTQIDTETGWIGNYRIVNITPNKLRLGRNVLAIQVQQNSGGAFFDCGVLRTEATTASLRLTSDKWHGFVEHGHNVDFTGTDVKAYKVVNIVGGTFPFAKAEEVGIVPAGEAVIVRSEKGSGTYKIPVTQAPATWNDNLLKATTASLSVTEDKTIYTITEQDGVSGFFPISVGSSLAKGKVYLDLSSSGINADCILISSDDEADGIGRPTPEASPRGCLDGAGWYNLAGQRITPHRGGDGGGLRHGFYIIGGRKVAVSKIR